MTKVRKLANRTLLAGSLLMSPACRSAVVAKPPSTVNPIQTTTGLYDKARISKPQDFTYFEPILEKMTNEKPVPWTSVHFEPDEKFVKSCGSLAGACLSPGMFGDEIFLKETSIFPASINFCDPSRKNCTSSSNGPCPPP